MTRFMKRLNNISRSQSVFRAARLSAEGIAASHHTFILAICRMPGCSQEELAREICLNKSTVARAVEHLERAGYLRRVRASEDRRSLLLYPTEAMLALLPRVRALADEWNALLAAGIDEGELAVFYRVLSQMEERARAMAAEGVVK